MELRSNKQPLARRLLGHYLMFGLTSMVALSISWAIFGQSLVAGTEERDLITRINEVRSLIAADQTENSGIGTKTLIQLLGTEDWVAYAGVVGPDGTFTAHSKPSRVGLRAERHFSDGSHERLLERNVVWSDGQRQREIWVPIVADGKNRGSLLVGLVSETDATWLKRLTDWLPFAILAPAIILSIGAVFLRRAARTNTAIEDQLFAVSTGNSANDLPLHPLDEPGPAAVGWNRLIEQVLGQRTAVTLDSKLSQQLGSLHEKRFERVLNSLPDGIAVTDKDGCVTYTNRPFGVLLQRSANDGQLRGRPIQELFPQGTNLQMNTAQESRPAVFEVAVGPTPQDGVLRVGRSPLLGDENTVLQHIWIVRDITQQKLADEMRNQFLYSATHELRTPLANIKAYAETLTVNDITDPEQQKGFLNIINSEATRLARFVEDLLSVSQMEAGSMSLAKTEVDLERLLVEVADKTRPQMLQKHITFETTMPPKIPKLRVDKDKFTGAIVNLLGNAAKYTPDNGHVAFKVVVGAKDIQISVEDTGLGISSEELPKLFTKFFRSADSRVRDIPGSGLGLAFAQEVARLHGGKLVVHSELNKGSQFTMVLPID